MPQLFGPQQVAPDLHVLGPFVTPSSGLWKITIRLTGSGAAGRWSAVLLRWGRFAGQVSGDAPTLAAATVADERIMQLAQGDEVTLVGANTAPLTVEIDADKLS